VSYLLTVVATITFSTNVCPSAFTAVICQCALFWLWLPVGFSWCTKFRRKWLPPFLFRIGTCEDKITFRKYAADRQIHCGVSTGHVRANIYHIIPFCWYQLCDRLSTASSSCYIICVTAGLVTSHSIHMSLHEDSWIMNSKGFGRILSCPRRYSVLAFALRTE